MTYDKTFLKKWFSLTDLEKEVFKTINPEFKLPLNSELEEKIAKLKSGEFVYLTQQEFDKLSFHRDDLYYMITE